MTPLDYRLSAATQFRLLSSMCSSMREVIERLHDAFLTQQIVTRFALSPATFEQEVEALLDKFARFRDMALPPSLSTYVAIITSRLGGSHSTWNFFTYHQMIQGSDIYLEQNTLYPRRDNVSYQGVSLLLWHLFLLSTDKSRSWEKSVGL